MGPLELNLEVILFILPGSIASKQAREAISIVQTAREDGSSHVFLFEVGREKIK